MLDIQTKLREVLNKSNSLPFLFVGSGMSRRYLGLPDWGGLLKEFLDEDDVEYQMQKTNGNYPKVATYIQEKFLEIFWKSEEYKSMKTEYKKLGFTGEEYPFKFAIAQYFENIDYSNYQYKEEIEAFKKVNIDGIITTNYDNFLETIFDFKVYKGQDDLFFTKTMEIGEIYKIHGCCTKSETIVINEDDYKRFKEQNLYLTSKLTSLFMEHPIIFLGYSLSDENVTAILKNIASSIGNDKLELLQDRIIFVEYETEKSKQFFEPRVKNIDGLNIPITHIKTDDFLSIYKVLSATQRKIPAKCLRMMENSIYELIKTNDPQGKMAVVDIDKISDYTDIEFYAGIGVVNEVSNKGYNCIERIDLFEDLIFDEDNYKFPENIITKTLPKLFQKTPSLKIIPIFKYLQASHITKENYKSSSLHPNIEDVINQNISLYKVSITHFTVDTIFLTNVFESLEKEEYSKIDLERFQNFLSLNKKYLDSKLNSTTSGYYMKLACLYDRLKYGWF